MPTYAGVGSRETPPAVLQLLRAIGRALAVAGYTLRSGAADGADAAFEAGCDDVNGHKQIFLPWRGFNKHLSCLFDVSSSAMAVASGVHPAWDRLQQGPRKLHGRNAYQVLGLALNDPVAFTVCWTADGCVSSATRTRKSGGTATAVVLSEQNGIPVYNLNNPASLAAFASMLSGLGIVVEGLQQVRRPEQSALF